MLPSNTQLGAWMLGGWGRHEKPIWKGSHNPRSWGLTITMVANFLQVMGMILQVSSPHTDLLPLAVLIIELFWFW